MEFRSFVFSFKISLIVFLRMSVRILGQIMISSEHIGGNFSVFSC